MDKRTAVYTKGNGKCWYCGVDLYRRKWHIDHFLPIVRDSITKKYKFPERDSFNNLVPSCIECNQLKGKKDIEEFRLYIPTIVSKLQNKDKVYRTANNYDLIKKEEVDIVFHFEKMNYQIHYIL